jgi:hypothetical protein
MSQRFCHSYEEAAEYSGFTVEQLKRAVRLRLIGYRKPARNSITFNKADLDKYAERLSVRPLLK